MCTSVSRGIRLACDKPPHDAQELRRLLNEGLCLPFDTARAVVDTPSIRLVEARQMGHSAECDLCGEMVDWERAIPNARGEACHKRCWAEYTGGPDWFSDCV